MLVKSTTVPIQGTGLKTDVFFRKNRVSFSTQPEWGPASETTNTREGGKESRRTPEQYASRLTKSSGPVHGDFPWNEGSEGKCAGTGKNGKIKVIREGGRGWGGACCACSSGIWPIHTLARRFFCLYSA